MSDHAPAAASPARPLRLFEVAAGWIEARARLLLAAFAGLYLVLTVPIAVREPLSNDEVYTYYFTRVPGLGDLWRALQTGAEQTPPLSYVLTRGSFGLFGVSNLTIRLPEVLAFLGFCLCTYVFVSRRSNRLYGLIAMLVPTVSIAYTYAYEARSYALVLAFAAAALLSWQLATEGVRRRLALPALAAALALATLSNYYAVLLLVPLGLGELVRTAQARRIDWPVWAALAGTLVPLPFLIPLIDGARSYSDHFWASVSWRDATDFYAWLSGTSVVPRMVFIDRDRAVLVLTLGALALAVLAGRRLPRGDGPLAALAGLIVVVPLGGTLVAAALFDVTLFTRELALALLLLGLAAYVAWRARSGRPLAPTLPAHELAAVVGFALLPLATMLLAKAATGVFVPRYTLSAVLGLAILLPLALYRLEARRPAIGVTVLVLLIVGFIGYAVSENRFASRQIARQHDVFVLLHGRATGSLPILIAHPHDYLELAYVAPPDLAPRVVHLASPEVALRRNGSDTVERGLLELKRLGPLHVLDYKSFVRQRRPFFAVVTHHFGEWNWVFPELRADGFTITPVAARGGAVLYRVTP